MIETNLNPIAVAPRANGLIAGLIACVCAVIGILFIGFIFVPIALLLALPGSYLAIRSRHIVSICVNALAWLLIAVGFVTSPMLLGMIGLAGVIGSGVAF